MKRRWYSLYSSPGRGPRFPLDPPVRFLSAAELEQLRQSMKIDGLRLWAFGRRPPGVQPLKLGGERVGSGRKPRVPVLDVHNEEIDGQTFTVTTFKQTGSTRQRPFSAGKVEVSLSPDGTPAPRKRKRRSRKPR